MGMTVEPEGLDRIERIIASAQATGYYSDAVEIHGLHTWMSNYHVASTLRAHSAIHPAGPILFFYLFVKSLGASSAAFVSGTVIGLIASAGVFVIYRFAGLWTEEPRARLFACTFYALPVTVTTARRRWVRCSFMNSMAASLIAARMRVPPMRIAVTPLIAISTVLRSSV